MWHFSKLNLLLAPLEGESQDIGGRKDGRDIGGRNEGKQEGILEGGRKIWKKGRTWRHPCENCSKSSGSKTVAIANTTV